MRTTIEGLGRPAALVAAGAIALALACGNGGGGGGNVTPPPPTANGVADAHADETVVAKGFTVRLDGSKSSDPEGMPLTYAWTQTHGPNVSGGAALTGAQPTFRAPDEVSTLVFELRVNDGNGPGAPDTVRIDVLENASAALWVDGDAGDDALGLGTREAPYRTIAKALADAAAAPTAERDVYVRTLAGGAAYDETGSALLVPQGTSLYGGYGDGWVRRERYDAVAPRTRIAGASTAIHFQEVTIPAWLSGLEVTAAQSASPDVSVFAVLAEGGAGGALTIDDVALVAGDVAPGASAAEPGSSYGVAVVGVDSATIRGSAIVTGAGGAAAPGDPGEGYAWNARAPEGNDAEGRAGAGGGAGTNLLSGGRGGDGGVEWYQNGMNGYRGEPWVGGGVGGAGGSGCEGVLPGCYPGRGGDGANGEDSPNGAYGGGGLSVTGSSALFRGGAGGIGAPGYRGCGGGGGGGGEAPYGVFSSGGGGGGGGGAGGAGGGGGNGGAGGGASVGIWLVGVAAAVEDTTLTIGPGGAGGGGGPGGAGQNGGHGGFGFETGGLGGSGGAGGDGGAGGGGGGGPSIGVYVGPELAPSIWRLSGIVGAGGNGGSTPGGAGGEGGHSYGIYDADAAPGGNPGVPSFGDVEKLMPGVPGAGGDGEVPGQPGQAGLTNF